MGKVSFTKVATQDLSNIWNYTFDRWSEKQADKYYNQLISKCNDLGKYPNLGRPYENVYHALNGVRIKKHIIFYRILDNENIEIERVLHQRMDLDKRMLGI